MRFRAGPGWAGGRSCWGQNHGYVPTDEDLAEITVGADTRDSVTEAVGPPVSTGLLDDGSFYYVQSQFRYYGALAPKLVSRQVLAISFDSRGVVSISTFLRKACRLWDRVTFCSREKRFRLTACEDHGGYS